MKGIAWPRYPVLISSLLMLGLLAGGCDYPVRNVDPALSSAISTPQARQFLGELEKSSVLAPENVKAVDLERSGGKVVVTLWLKGPPPDDTLMNGEVHRFATRLSTEVFDGTPVEIRLMRDDGTVLQRVLAGG